MSMAIGRDPTNLGRPGTAGRFNRARLEEIIAQAAFGAICGLPNLHFIVNSHRFGTTARLSPQIGCRWRIPLV